MTKVRDLRDVYKTVSKKNNGKSVGKAPSFVSSGSGSANQTEISIISNEIKSYTQPRKNCNTSVPEGMKNGVGENALMHGTKSALEKFGKNYPKYTFVRTSVKNWKKKVEKDKKNDNPTVRSRKYRSNLLDEEFLVKVNDMVTGGVISEKMLIAIDTGVIKANCPEGLWRSHCTN